MSQKEKLLAAATPKEWDCWLTELADQYAPKGRVLLGEPCYFCEAFAENCQECCGIDWDMKVFTAAPCYRIDEFERIDRAIARLEAAGIWEEV